MVKLTKAEFESIDKKVKEVLREPPILGLLSRKPSDPGKKEHAFLSASDMPEVRKGADFSYDMRNYPLRTETGVKLTYLTYPVKISRSDIDASSSYGIESLLTTAEIEGNSVIAKEIEEVVTHGSIERKSKGMCNYDNLLTYGDNSKKALTAFGNFFSQLEGAISTIRSEHIKPPYDLIWTPGIPAELRGNWISGVKNEYEQFKETYLEGGVIGSVSDTDAIATTSAGKRQETLSTTTQCFIVAKLGEPYNYIAESYPLHRDGINKEFDSDIGYALEWAGGFIPKNTKAICLITGLETSTAY